MIIKPISLKVIHDVCVEITIPQIYLNNGQMHTLAFELTKPLEQMFKTRTGKETVVIINGVDGNKIALETRAGNRFFSDRLFLCRSYRLIYGNDGAANSHNTSGGVEHFINLDTPRTALPYNPHGLDTPVEL